MAWYDFFKLFWYCCPGVEPKAKNQACGAYCCCESIPDIRGDDTFWAGGKFIRLKENDFIDLTTVANRQYRYKQYERWLQADPDLNQALNNIVERVFKQVMNEVYLQEVPYPRQGTAWTWIKNLAVYGDLFIEKVIDNGKVVKLAQLPADTMYRIETTKGELVEYQQSKEGPDYQSLASAPLERATAEDLNNATAVRFQPYLIVHVRLPGFDKGRYPYGTSLLDTRPDSWSQEDVDRIARTFVEGLREMKQDVAMKVA